MIIRALVTYDKTTCEWSVSLRKGRSFFGATRQQAIEAAMGSLREDTTIRIIQ